MAKASNVGFKVYKEKMPISNITKKLCDEFGIDPLKFISSGSMVITTENGEELVKKMAESGIEATIIGCITKEKGILVDEKIEIEVAPPERDELFKIF